jgi:hypothetical protein
MKRKKNLEFFLLNLKNKKKNEKKENKTIFLFFFWNSKIYKTQGKQHKKKK